MSWVNPCLNPFRTGRGLSTYLLILNDVLLGFNPFGAGRGLSTLNHQSVIEQEEDVSIPLEQGRVFRRNSKRIDELENVSIPLEQGRVFRLKRVYFTKGDNWSQSLWSRAGSFDILNFDVVKRIN